MIGSEFEEAFACQQLSITEAKLGQPNSHLVLFFNTLCALQLDLKEILNS